MLIKGSQQPRYMVAVGSLSLVWAPIRVGGRDCSFAPSVAHWGSGRASTWGGDIALPPPASLKWPDLGAERITGTETPGGASNSAFGRRNHGFPLWQPSHCCACLSPKGRKPSRVLLLLGLRWSEQPCPRPQRTAKLLF